MISQNNKISLFAPLLAWVVLGRGFQLEIPLVHEAICELNRGELVLNVNLSTTTPLQNDQEKQKPCQSVLLWWLVVEKQK